MKTPVAFIIFNRRETTQRVFNAIAEARPPRLLVIADGPRTGVEGERERCEQTRAVIEQVDWECEVLTNFAEVNMGLEPRVISGLNWVFEHCEEAIVFEDDCLPHPTLFPYCDDLLERYRDDERVMMLSGCNFHPHSNPTPYSYHFTRYSFTWGWATWRRAWQHFDAEMRLWPLLRETPWLSDLLGDEAAARFFRGIFDRSLGGFLEWDYRWMFACWAQNGLAVTPSVNLLSNIGFGTGATHTTNTASPVANLPAMEISFPLEGPPFMARDSEADRMIFRHIYPWAIDSPGLSAWLRRSLSAIMSDPMRKSLATLARQRQRRGLT